MEKTKNTQGKCLCGAVTVEIKGAKGTFGACHCGMCRNWGGGPFLAVEAGTEVKFTGEESITAFKSSDWAERGFCKKCGTHLFYRLSQAKQYFMPLGLMSDADRFEFDHQVFIDRKPGNYDFANRTATMTEAEVFAKFGA